MNKTVMAMLAQSVCMCVCVLACFSSSEGRGNPLAAGLPHIIFIVADDLGWTDVGWRDPNMYTPNLNHFASRGVILNSTYVQPVCSPSRSAFMSGYFPFHTGLQHLVILPAQNVGLPANLTTLPEQLKKLGYATHAVGKWHLGFCNWKYTPTYRGFDSFMGYYNAAEDYYTHQVTWNDFFGLDLRKDLDVDQNDTGRYSTYFYTGRATEIIRAHNKSQPLFLYLPFQSVHEPLEVPSWYEDQYCMMIKNGTRRTKCGMVAILDEAVGNITRLLDAEGYLDNALVIFTSDNGGPVWAAGLNWPLRGAKTTVWEGGTRATAFLYSRNLLKSRAGTVHEGMMHAVDWLPTIMSVVGGDTPAGIDGVSQWESIAKGLPSPRTEFVYNMDNLPVFSAAIRNGDWKLIQGKPGQGGPGGLPWNDWYPIPGEEDAVVEGQAAMMVQNQKQPGPDDFQLYNIKDDPTEHHDVKDQYPDVLAQMKARLEQWRQGMVPANFHGDDPASNPKNYGGVWTPGWC